ncbi:TlpA family protein disulfide reductase [bacterium]|nr:TlpA family protein disulfide reductase [bacterium]
MKHLSLLFFLPLFLGFTSEQKAEPKQIIDPDGLNIPVYDFENFQSYIDRSSDSVYVINFWATWCKPCVAELPYFEQLTDSASKYNVNVTLVSLDFKSNWETGLVKFTKKMNLQSDVIVLHEPDANSWIPKIDADWSGAIPATLIKYKNQTWFHEGDLDYEELINTIKNIKS